MRSFARIARTSISAGTCHVSQEDFAAWYGFTINQIKDWEQGRARPIGGVRAYLMLIKQDPKAVHNLLHAALGGTVRKQP
jgi:putative transcriptional regulator